MSLPITHRCEKCGREFVWVDPHAPPFDAYGRYAKIDGKNVIVPCGGNIVPVTSSEPVADIPMGTLTRQTQAHAGRLTQQEIDQRTRNEIR